LVILDEARLTGTLALDELVREPGDAGPKVFLSGDWAQLPAVDAGGAFGYSPATRTPRWPSWATSAGSTRNGNALQASS